MHLIQFLYMRLKVNQSILVIYSFVNSSKSTHGQLTMENFFMRIFIVNLSINIIIVPSYTCKCCFPPQTKVKCHYMYRSDGTIK